MAAVENVNIPGFVKFGIGTEAQEQALKKFGCVKVFFPHELVELFDNRNLDVQWIFREADTVVMAQPGVISMKRLRQIDATGVSWQVPGHEPTRFTSDEERLAWRRQKPKGVNVVHERTTGRPPKYPAPTKEQIASMVALWHSGQRPALILPQVQKMMGADVPMHWLRDQIIKATGSARRKP